MTRSRLDLSQARGPREETRLLSRKCADLAKERESTGAGLYTSPMSAFLEGRTIEG